MIYECPVCGNDNLETTITESSLEHHCNQCGFFEEEQDIEED